MFTGKSMNLAELESVGIFVISQSVLKILCSKVKLFLFFNSAFTVNR